MPMIDYQCETCGYRFENYYHSDPPASLRCPSSGCSAATQRIHSLPGEYRPTNAQRFSPIVIWVNNQNPDQISMPGRADEPVQSGYHAVSITNLPQADYWARRMNNFALREALDQRAREKDYWDAVTKDRRDSIRARIGSNPRAMELFKRTCEYVDQKRERRYAKTLDPRGHFQVLSYDSSNRQGYADRETGWKERKA